MARPLSATGASRFAKRARETARRTGPSPSGQPVGPAGGALLARLYFPCDLNVRIPDPPRKLPRGSWTMRRGCARRQSTKHRRSRSPPAIRRRRRRSTRDRHCGPAPGRRLQRPSDYRSAPHIPSRPNAALGGRVSRRRPRLDGASGGWRSEDRGQSRWRSAKAKRKRGRGGRLWKWLLTRGSDRAVISVVPFKPDVRDNSNAARAVARSMRQHTAFGANLLTAFKAWTDEVVSRRPSNHAARSSGSVSEGVEVSESI